LLKMLTQAASHSDGQKASSLKWDGLQSILVRDRLKPVTP
jgi:hypothetical protein